MPSAKSAAKEPVSSSPASPASPGPAAGFNQDLLFSLIKVKPVRAVCFHLPIPKHTSYPRIPRPAEKPAFAEACLSAVCTLTASNHVKVTRRRINLSDLSSLVLECILSSSGRLSMLSSKDQVRHKVVTKKVPFIQVVCRLQCPPDWSCGSSRRPIYQEARMRMTKKWEGVWAYMTTSMTNVLSYYWVRS